MQERSRLATNCTTCWYNFGCFGVRLSLSHSLVSSIFVNLENEAENNIYFACDTTALESSSRFLLNDRHFVGHFSSCFARAHARARTITTHRHFIVRVHRYVGASVGFLCDFRAVHTTVSMEWRNYVQFLNCGLMGSRKERGASRLPLITISVKSWLFVVHLDSTSSHRNFNDIPFAFAAYSYSEQQSTSFASFHGDQSGFTRAGSVETHTLTKRAII